MWLRPRRCPSRCCETRFTLARPQTTVATLTHALQWQCLREIKRASPSKGDIAMGIDAPQQALAYALAGACTISTLTEPTWFKGSLQDLGECASGARRCWAI